MNRAAAQATSSQAQNSTQAQVNFNAELPPTGSVKQIDGHETKEYVLTLTMAAAAANQSDLQGSLTTTASMWVASGVPGETELRQFNLRMAQELGMGTGSNPALAMLNSRPGGAEALAEVQNRPQRWTVYR
jgi:hypothetical protein